MKHMNNEKLTSETSDPLKYLHYAFTRLRKNMKLNHTTNKEIDEIIKLLKPKNSHGYDEISTKILKASAPYILSPLTYIGNKILSIGIFPDRLKFSEIKPLFKKGNRTNCLNYRPSHYFHPSQKFSRKLYTKDCTNT